MMKYTTFAELERLLLTTINMPGSSIKDIASATGMKANTLYKWNCGAMRFSPDNIDKLLLYFQEHEPERLDRAEMVYDALRGIE